MPLDPRARRFLDTLAAMSPPSALSLSVQERRAALAHLLSFCGPLEEVTVVDRFELPGPGETVLRVRGYTRAGANIGGFVPAMV